jgi:hypothetical protein
LQTIQKSNEKTIDRVNKCQFCGKKFIRKSWFLRHSCAKKKKFEATNDVVYQHAFRVYSYWMQLLKLSRKGKEPTFDQFCKSPKFTLFVNVVEFAKEYNITSLYTYIEWLVAKRVNESNWCSKQTQHMDLFKQYSLEYEDPVDQTFATKKQIERWILEKPNERTAEVFFSKLTAGNILTMVRQGMIKPWPLLAYAPIADRWLSDEFYNADVFYRISDIINCNYWADKISEDIESVEIVTEIMDQLWQSQT